MRDSIPPELAAFPDYERRISEGFIECLADLHSVDSEKHGLRTLGKPKDFWIARSEAGSNAGRGRRPKKLPLLPQSGPMPERARSGGKAAANSDGQPTLYLIAFKDNGIVQALGYWVEDGNLHYVSAGHTLNQVSLDLVDRELSGILCCGRCIRSRLRVPSKAWLSFWTSSLVDVANILASGVGR